MKFILILCIQLLTTFAFCQKKDSTALFQFENSDPFYYTGSEDSIIKLIKRGNIHLNIKRDSTKYLLVYPFHSAFTDSNFVPGKFGIGSNNSLPYFKNQSEDSTKKKLEDKVNIGNEPRGNKVFGTDSSKATLTIFKKRNRSNTKTLSINRIVGLKTDSVYFRGQVTSFTDSVIAFHSYYRNGIMHDSAYVFTLKYIQQIKYCRAKNINKYLEKHVKQDKHLPQAPLYVLFGIGTSALIANAIGNLDNTFNENTDRAFNLISVYSYGLGFLYGACTIFPSAIKLRFFNMTTKWTFSSSNTITD